jgi:ribonuclease P protein component
MPKNGLRPSERLKSRRLIQALFKQGHSFSKYPIRLVYLPVTEPTLPSPVQCTVSVPKRRFRRAVHRNRIRRQVREAWRLHKQALYQQLEGHDTTYAFMLLYVGKEPMPYADIERSMRRVIKTFCARHDLNKPTE